MSTGLGLSAHKLNLLPDIDYIRMSVTGSPSFDPIITTSAGTGKWVLGDGTTINTNGITHAYGDTAVYSVDYKLKPITNITTVSMNDDGITGKLDLSKLSNMTNLFLDDNSGLTSIILPTSSAVTTSVKWINCASLAGTIDLSGMTGLGGTISLRDCPNITSYTFPTSSQSITQLEMYNCNLTGNLDISGLTNINAAILLFGNPLLTSVTTPVADTGNVTAFSASGTDLTGTLDLSGYLNLGGTISLSELPNLTKILFPPASTANIKDMRFDACNLSFAVDISGMGGLGGAAPRYLIGNDNPLLPSITLPSNSNTMRIFRLYGCDLGYIDFTVMPNIMEETNSEITLQNNNMTAAEVNQILVELDSIVTGGYVGIINLGGNNAAPDGTSGGYDGLTAKTNLIAKSKSVTTN
jgi:hypothetical protein